MIVRLITIDYDVIVAAADTTAKVGFAANSGPLYTLVVAPSDNKHTFEAGRLRIVHTKRVTFSTPCFADSPIVFAGFSGAALVRTNTNRVSLSLSNMSTNGFDVHLSSENAGQQAVSWFACDAEFASTGFVSTGLILPKERFVSKVHLPQGKFFEARPPSVVVAFTAFTATEGLATRVTIMALDVTRDFFTIVASNFGMTPVSSCTIAWIAVKPELLTDAKFYHHHVTMRDIAEARGAAS